MGLIQRQTLKASAVSYLGVTVGVLNTFFLYTYCFSESQLGEFRFIQDTAILLSGVFSLGLANVVVRFFPDFKNGLNGNNGFLGFLFAIATVGFVLYVGSYYLFRSYLPIEYCTNFKNISLILVGIVVLDMLFQYSSNFGRITIPTLIKNLWLKVGLAFVAIFYAVNTFDFEQILIGVPLVYILGSLGLAIYLKKLGEFKITFIPKFLTRDRVKKISTYAGFGVLGSLGSGLANRLDVYMVTDILDFSKTGVYTIALNAANILMIASGPILAISGPIIADSIKRNDIKRVDSIYKKSGLNLFILGLFLLLLLWSNVDSIFELIPNGEVYAYGKYVILILGLSKLFDLLTSVNGLIIAYSKYYRFNLYALLVLGVINVVANLFWIPLFDIHGAALATMTSILLYNMLKTYYVFAKFKIHPFQIENILAVFTALVIYFLIIFFPTVSNPFLTIVTKSIVITILFLLAIVKFNLSTQVVQVYKDYLKKFTDILGK